MSRVPKTTPSFRGLLEGLRTQHIVILMAVIHYRKKKYKAKVAEAKDTGSKSRGSCVVSFKESSLSGVIWDTLNSPAVSSDV